MKESELEKRIEKKLYGKTTITIVILTVLLIAAIGYIIAGEYAKAKSNRELNIYQQGIKAGEVQTVNFLFQQGCIPTSIFVENKTLTMIPIECIHAQARTCTQIPLTVNNQTLNLIATECLSTKN